ncbi:hypothetical protein XENTR_v10001572 [Xenopus tropicalis]|uniref:Jun D proto-oncogene, gene 2 n=1 Tax=Xenopus tropicalis TaxID=8364 RepID=A0A803JUH5_XENTR|nr:transcription factor jun-D [Xenopus tropicalis]XP_004910966.1 transcription factor jun-D [Xenopus tropicalis]KAE8632540.1 hypothetical protein XENTR_v10001572 [Xenopus tropicalis]|eukprot:XP_004910965.1 PREDICTED: transcription factor jun-D-like [Xenopus tropicalis]
MMMTSSTSTDHVKLEPPFYHEETLNLQEFAQMAGYSASGSPGSSGSGGQQQGAHREPGVRYQDHKLMGANIIIQGSNLKKKNMATVAPAVIQQGFPGEALKLMPGSGETAVGNNPVPAAGEGGAGAGAVPSAAAGSTSNSNSNGADVPLLPGTAAASSAALSLLKLSPPEIEHLLIQAANSGSAPSPASSAQQPTIQIPPFLYRSQPVITQEQEGFADGFVKALADLHKQNQLLGAPISPTALAAGSPSYPVARTLLPAGEVPVYTNLSSFNPANAQLSPPIPQAPQPTPYSGNPSPGAVQLQFPGLGRLHAGRGPLDEPQTVPDVSQAGAAPSGGSTGGTGDSASPPTLSPIDLETQERIKAERKRLRNRIAASKCRKRKLERIARLEEKVKVLKSQNSDLASTASLLREQVSQLKQKVMSHVTSGCQIAVSKSAPGGKGAGESQGC